MSLTVLPRSWSALCEPLLTAIDERRNLTLAGLYGPAKGLVLAALASSRAAAGPPLLVVVPNQDLADELYGDVLFFQGLLGHRKNPPSLFPDWGILPYAPTPPPVEVIGKRMQVLDLIQRGESNMVIAPVQAFLQRLLPSERLAEASFTLTPAQTIERAEFVGRLLRLGYRQVSAVQDPGQFSIRGGITDLFSTVYDAPHRIEFLGDAVETMRRFDPSTQKSSGRTTAVRVLPAREYLLERRAAPEAIPPDAEWRGPAIYPSMETLIDYFPSSPVVITDNVLELRKQSDEFLSEAKDAYDQNEGARQSLPPPGELFLPLPELLEAGGARCLFALEAIASGIHESAAPHMLNFETQRPQGIGIGVKGRPFSETIPHLELLRAHGPVVIVARSRGQVERLQALFQEHDLPAEPSTTLSLPERGSRSPYAITEGEVSGGFVKLEGQWEGRPGAWFSVVTEDELFAKGGRHKTHSTTKGAAFLRSIEELKIGDCVVHLQHGIGRYIGMQRLPVQGFDSDYLIIEYAGGDKVYVPLDRLHHVQRYASSEGRAPKLDHLGGKTWERTKSRARKSIEEMAKDLIAVQAAREVRGRMPFSTDTVLSHEFDAAFEYEETADQLRAIEDVKRDMESEKPMDRLVCGDVGYGKTEVAMRAVFKAVLDNKQAAVLVPTTLLAQQHFENFSDRFAPFPVKVAVLSRFQSPKDQKLTLRGAADGTVDIVIGTHRLLQKDVQFRNLGLVVIDEEQWFGVKNKERLKQLRAEVDILTLTATPIPRTLQMAMSGLRELPVIETPPADRLAIRTQVMRFGKVIIREAILRELARGGQIFFVHNRVQTIERMGAFLRELVPEARTVAAHGQMDSRLVESVMLRFHRHEADLLLSTSIIESGLDIPNANTIFVDRADTFGLAQLYQLRGRVGRGKHQAYAYFLVAENDTLTEEAQQRLQAIPEFTASGSGLRVAAADLEIRGGGNLLGKEQSGHIAAIGFELYMQMLDQAVGELKGQPVAAEVEPALQLRISAFIPDDYVTEAAERLSLYKRLSSSAQTGDIAELHGELVDRYGAAPEAVERLFEVMEIRMLAKAARAAAIQVNPGVIAVTFDVNTDRPQSSARSLIDLYRSRLRFTAPHAFQVSGPTGEWKNVFQELKRILKVLAVHDKKP